LGVSFPVLFGVYFVIPEKKFSCFLQPFAGGIRFSGLLAAYYDQAEDYQSHFPVCFMVKIAELLLTIKNHGEQ